MSVLVMGLALSVVCLIPTASATTSVATTTTLSASATTSTYDSPILFTAKVSALAAFPSGTVTFVDTSNGSVLGSVALGAGKAALETAALAPGSRSIVARFDGNPTFTRSRSASLDISVSPLNVATSEQIGSTHAGAQPGMNLALASLRKRWSVTPGGASGSGLSYPIIADHRVFTSSAGGTGTIYALDAATGATDWFSSVSSSYGLAGLTYDGQRLFALTSEGVLIAFDAGSGHEDWAEQLPRQYSFSAAPTAYDGVVYASGAGLAGTVYAVSEATGIVHWTQSVENGDDSSPAVNHNGVFVSYACQQDYRFLISGAAVWHDSGNCEGGGGGGVALYGGSVYALGFPPIDTPFVLTQASGKKIATFSSNSMPAFGQSNMYVRLTGNLLAVDPSGSPDRWIYGQGTFVTAPVTDQKTVFIGAANGTVSGVSSTGKLVWRGVAGTSMLGGTSTGLALGQGLLVAPAAATITAFGG
ncbi:MAG TPA: PQQ-binding-like beta-propeller repeat protein [Solirubrobacteraceae bacterium]|nr:PQQ-binding-like beta-propeller repeat protein [Solirubrobacteraceae bacterium]